MFVESETKHSNLSLVILFEKKPAMSRLLDREIHVRKTVAGSVVRSMSPVPLPGHEKQVINKIAFQWDAYRPLVDRVPACTARGCQPRGVSGQGVSVRGYGRSPL